MPVLLVIAASFLVMSPTTILAYSTPEEVLFQNDFFFPPTNRDAEARVQKQKEERLERFKKQQEKDLQEPSPVEPTPSLEETLASLNDALESIEQQNTPDARRDTRLLERIERREQPTALPSRHSGAPLAPTGAGSVVAVGAILAAALWTIRRARGMQER